MSEPPLVRVRHVHKFFTRGSERVDVLQDLSLDVPDGAFWAMMGPSGSGKTTLLNLIAGLDRPSEGEVEVGGDRISALSKLSHDPGLSVLEPQARALPVVRGDAEEVLLLKPDLVLVGRYTLGENITRYTTADPMQHPLYRFFREHTSWESGDTVKYVETNCNSVLNWSVTAFSEVDDVYGQAAEHLFRYYGFALDMTHSAALHEQAQTYADAQDLPGYPRAGAIVDCGDYVLVNLQ